MRPVLSIAPRKVVAPFAVAGWELPPGVARGAVPLPRPPPPRASADPTAFRPERFLGGAAPDRYSWIPFGGGVRRCVGAAFATMELREVLRAVAAGSTLRPEPAAAASGCAGAA